MADVRRQQHLVLAGTGDDMLAVGEAAVFKRGIDDGGVVARRQRLQRVVAHAKAPALGVVRRLVGDEVGLIGQRVDVLFQLIQGQHHIDGRRVAQDVQVRGAKIDHALTARVGDVGVGDVPLARDRPVEHGSARRHLGRLDVDVAAEDAERPAHAVAGDAAADRIELGGEVVDPLPHILGVAEGALVPVRRGHVLGGDRVRPQHGSHASACRREYPRQSAS